MEVCCILYAVVAWLLIYYIYREVHRPRNYPPGPMWFPLVGNFLQLKKMMQKEQYQHMVFNSLSRKYKSPVVGLKLGSKLTVVVSGIQAIRQVLTQEEFEGRPDSYFIRLRTMGVRRGVTCTDGELWQEQRGFVVRHLRRLGYGRQKMEDMLQDELKKLITKLGEGSESQGIHMGPLLAMGVLNVLWTLVAGTHLPQSGTSLHNLLCMLNVRSRVFDMAGGMLNQIPWIRFLAPEKVGFTLISDINSRLKTILLKEITTHVESYKSEETRDLIDAFLHQMYSEEKQGEFTNFNEDQLMMVCLDLFFAGSQTTSNTLDFAFLMMLLYPRIQELVRNEILSVVGSDRSPTLSDRPNLPYVETVLMEVQRMYHVTPVAGPRRVLRDTKLSHWTIPKGTIVLINLFSVHMDHDHWGDPDVFRPERFLNADGAIESDDWLIPYGLGRRRCLGETLARSCIFLFFTGLMQHYELSLPFGQNLPSAKPLSGMTLSPQNYQVLLKPVSRSPINA